MRWIRSLLAERRSGGNYDSLMKDLGIQSGYENFYQIVSRRLDILNLIALQLWKPGNIENQFLLALSSWLLPNRWFEYVLVVW